MEQVYVVYQNNDRKEGILVPVEETFRACPVDYSWYAVKGVPTEAAEKLNERLPWRPIEWLSGDDEGSLTDWLIDAGFANAEVARVPSTTDGYHVNVDELRTDTLYYDEDNNCFFEIADLDDDYLVIGYEYWDGSNWQTLTFRLEEDADIIEYDYEKREDLQYWDGSNWCSILGGSRTRHYLCPVVRLNGEEAADKFLLYEQSLYQGTLSVGCIITSAEAKDLLSDERL